MHDNKILSPEQIADIMLENNKFQLIELVELQQSCNMTKNIIYSCLIKKDINFTTKIANTFLSSTNSGLTLATWLLDGIYLNIWQVLDTYENTQPSTTFKHDMCGFIRCITQHDYAEISQEYPYAKQQYVNQFLSNPTRAERYLTWLL